MINKRIYELDRRVQALLPDRITVLFADGKEIVTDPCGAIALCKEDHSIARFKAQSKEQSSFMDLLQALL